MNRRNRICFLVLFVCFCLTGCAYKVLSDNDLIGLSAALGIDLTEAEILEMNETHGGFHNDGTTYYKIAVADSQHAALMKELEESSRWSELPLTDNLRTAVYDESLIVDSEFNCLFPEIEHGYYYFNNRQGATPHEELDPVTSYSYNFTIAIFDQDTDTLYYFRLDT